jgi:hypothetical protein
VAMTALRSRLNKAMALVIATLQTAHRAVLTTAISVVVKVVMVVTLAAATVVKAATSVVAVTSLPVKNAALHLAKTATLARATKVSHHALTLLLASQAASPSQLARCLCPAMLLKRPVNFPSQHAIEFDPGLTTQSV